MKKVLALLVAMVVATSMAFADATLINGAGATFPYPIYSKWFDEYAKANPGVLFNYQSIGSGGGIKQISAKTVDFGATDGPMSIDQLTSAPGRIYHIPTVMGAVVIAYNLEGVTKGLKLSGDVLADIYLGKITQWNDPRITEQNAGVTLPNSPIVVVHRSDGSGTSFIFTDYLSSVSGAWKGKVGKGTSVNWPVGLGGKGNEGVAGMVKQASGSIGYVELAYAKQNGLSYASIKNQSGSYIEPSLASTSKAADGAAIPADFRVSLVNSANPEAYPIASFTWLLIYKQIDDHTKGAAIVNFIKWAITDGQKYAEDLDYAPLPSNVVEMIQKKLDQVKY
ncbi:MAG: phosphate ABC transporter substrate-binding protein PstS [Candidatus Omnitrophica bacterium]|nr:phosphate ABC transporter substrate-binding protein PstS [Candidatus Omnitrophota bacterium]